MLIYRSFTDPNRVRILQKTRKSQPERTTTTAQVSGVFAMNIWHTRIALVFTALALMILNPVGRPAHATSSTPDGGKASLDCSVFTLAPTSQSFSFLGGSATFHVDTDDDCSWSAVSPFPWITVDSSPRSGDGTVSYSVAANSGPPRNAAIQLAPKGGVVVSLSISQGETTCRFTINPKGAHFSVSGGSGSFDATFPAGCSGPHPVSQGLDWVTIQSVSGSKVSYSVAANTGAARLRDLVLDPLEPLRGSFTIAQDGGGDCPATSISLSPSSETFDADGSDSSVDINAPDGCSISAVSTVDWISIALIGVKSVTYQVFPNRGSWRSGFIVINGQNFTVYQDPPECPIDLYCSLFPSACPRIGKSAGVIDVGHSFRDRVLAKSERGRRYTHLYYQFSREAVLLMLSNPMLLLRSRDMLTTYKPVLESMVKGDSVDLSSGDLSDIDEFLATFSEKASPDLKAALGGLRKDLKDPAVHSEFNITIVQGPKRGLRPVSFHRLPKFLALPSILLGACGLVLGGFVRRPRIPLLKLAKRSPPVLLAFALIAWPALPNSARLSNRPRGPMMTLPGELSLDAQRPLTTGPALSYLTYLGGSGGDEGTAIAADSAGNAYVAGSTSSPNFPTMNASQASLAGGQQDAFVCKLGPSGNLIYSTYLGGSGQDNATAIAVDSAGNAYVAGFTDSPNFPVKNAFQPSLKGRLNAFLTKFDPAGSVVYSTYLGGSLGDLASGIAVDSSGNAYVAGVTISLDFPVAGPAQMSLGGASNAFVAKLSPDGSRLIYSTYLGGRDTDGAAGISVDSTGQAYITGVTSSRNFPTVNAFRSAHGGGFFDAFVAKLNAAGNQFLYSTYLGGTGEDRGLRIAVDAAGNAYVTGDTDSSDFPTANAIQPSNKGSSDAFLAKLNPAGSAILYSTYIGGGGLDGGTSIAVDANGIAYVGGFTASNDFPLASPIQQSFGGGSFDAFLLVLDPSGSRLPLSSYLGGSGIDSGFGIAADSKGGLYLMGQTNSKDLPVSRALQVSYGGDPSDVFVGKINIGPLITAAQVSGKKLLVSGIGFDNGATVLLNGDPERTVNDGQSPTTALVARKAGRLIGPGQTVTLQVKNSDGSLSNQFTFMRPAG
jgi:hypothetical protein